MNIQELVRRAKERIDSMSIDELRAKFLEHGYVPANQKSHLSYSLFVQCDVPISLNVKNDSFVSTYEGAIYQVNQNLFNHIHASISPRVFEHLPLYKIPANQADYSISNSCDLDLAA
jgi:hypothetical protein